ncbi:MAG: vitamin B12-dependent ribonucleotide reductase [Rhodothermaceae bacterium]|nr:vitamin B12-dependent ribonucleotide reductase [Rhodothermaceae bacterium]
MKTTTDNQISSTPPTESTKDGLSIKRVFSAQGENALDSVDWERRDAVIKNPQGESVFEQKDVEFPTDWSLLATNVVASKYFYGDQTNAYLDPDEGGREYSLRQLIHRVTRTITDWGHKQGYFSTQQDADCFYDELTWLCVNQHGSFNSPVWFNVGLHDCYGVKDSGDRTIWGWDPTKQDIADVDPYEYPQGSACFIISVEDSIDDIWKLMSESARLFKFGSGVGADWSTLRSTHEKLSGGGIPSGPVSFMRVQDATGGTIKSGGKTRRAAIMQTLKICHPDVMEFIDAKKTEEKKAWALIEQGYDGSFNGPAYGSVAFQNVNQSVRVNDEFMHSAESGALFALRKVTTDEVVTEVDARMVLDRIADGTHICGDPGMQYEDTIQRWHTCKATGPINSSNPCSEYMFLDNSACNLASLNLRKFQQEDGSFDVERFRAAVRIFITAMEIIVDNAGYPSESIARNSHLFRPLGLGFANLGALLMAMGLPYDSDEGRAVAGAIMAIEHAEAYARSAEIAANPRIGPFEGYEENCESMLNVMRMHRNAADEIDQSCPDYLLSAAKESLDRMVTLGECHGYRNSQVTVLAPTGTIAFMMDCDTTGIEPDIALVKYKLLAGKGDGTLKIINHTVPEALARLGYDEEQIESILDFVSEHDTIEGAPELDEEHLPVFDCAFKPFKGTRSVHSMGHIRMMAACQPFVSGAISKTVNMPEDVTVDEIGEAYMEGWRLGLKALAIYRENSKRSQPLSTSKGGNTKGASSGDGLPEVPKVVEKTNGRIVYKSTRKRLPDERPALTHKFSVSGHEGYLHVGLYPDTNLPGEIFIRMAKEGSTISGLMDAFATSVSIALQYGVPLEDLCAKFSFMRFEPSGITNNPRIPMAASIMDYIFRYLALTFTEEQGMPDVIKNVIGEIESDIASQQGTEGEQHVALELESVQVSPTETGATQTAGAVSTEGSTYQHQDDAPICPTCGSITVRSGACYVCTHCGSSSGCG